MITAVDSIGIRVGGRLRALRSATGLTQAQLAERVGAGVEPETISRYERGVRIPTLPVLAELAAAAGSDLDSFLAGVIDAAPVDRTELRKVQELLEPLDDAHLRAIRRLLAAHLEAVEAGRLAMPR